jgi:hypothetical protein
MGELMLCSMQKSSDEEELVSRCLEGEEDAWETLFHLYHRDLVSIISSQLQRDDTEQAEEIAARVWSTLLNDDCLRLRRYDARLGRLLNFLGGIARREIWKGRRAERNRHTREHRAARSEATSDDVDGRMVIQEFLGMLTPREREFFLSDLVSETDSDGQAILSAANIWQLRSRVLKKFRAYCRRDSE